MMPYSLPAGSRPSRPKSTAESQADEHQHIRIVVHHPAGRQTEYHTTETGPMFAMPHTEPTELPGNRSVGMASILASAPV